MYPSHYNPSNCNWDYNPDIQKLFESATQFKKSKPDEIFRRGCLQDAFASD